MGIARRCPNCLRSDNISASFYDKEAERKYHSEKWCDCNYFNPEEMMFNQDLGFKDGFWLPIAIGTLRAYHRALSEKKLPNDEEKVRFFLKTLEYQVYNWNKKVILEDSNFYDIDKWEPRDGKPETEPRMKLIKDGTLWLD